MPAPRRRLAALMLVPMLAGVAACANGALAAGAASVDLSAGDPARTLRLGYLANVTHAPAVVGIAEGFLARDLGTTALETQVFNAGPAAVEALNAGAIDAAYLGPGPAINAFVQSDGASLRIVAGAVSGGAQLVVRRDITAPAGLRGADLATPQLGGTQDVALRSWLSQHGLQSPLSGGGDVTVTPTDNAQTLQLFRAGELDGAWLPEPWASRLVLDAGAKVLVDERSLWPRERFVTTHLVVSTRFLREHPQTVKALVQADVQSIDWIAAHRDEAEAVVNEEIGKATGTPLPPAVIDRAFDGITVTADPLAGSLSTLLEHAVSAGLTKQASLDGIYDLRLLNDVLTADGRSPVSAAGLGKE